MNTSTLTTKLWAKATCSYRRRLGQKQVGKGLVRKPSHVFCPSYLFPRTWPSRLCRTGQVSLVMWWAPASQIIDPENIYSQKSMPGAWLSPADPEVKCPTPASRCFALLWRESRPSMARGKSRVQSVEQSFERHLPLAGWLLRDNQERLKVGDKDIGWSKQGLKC